uniref:Uncharacterized protein n=1 Tax=Rousettus aegyptiacus TaxID=9407 RepID=A0A7J8E8G7_ROUAE|nr:hypothetical protein HJG63_008132 [Rousettus aegyptiacus]
MLETSRSLTLLCHPVPLPRSCFLLPEHYLIFITLLTYTASRLVQEKAHSLSYLGRASSTFLPESSLPSPLPPSSPTPYNKGCGFLLNHTLCRCNFCNLTLIPHPSTCSRHGKQACKPPPPASTGTSLLNSPS